MLKRVLNPERWVAFGLAWAVVAYLLNLLLEISFGGDTYTGSGQQLLTGAALWAAGGLAFGGTMRSVYRWERRRAR